MPDEQKDDQKREGETTQTDSGQAEYEKKVAELEAKKNEEVEKLKREIQQKEEMLDSLTPYVDWEKATGQPSAKSDYTESAEDKTMEDRLRKIQSSYDVKLAAMQFRIDNPDLKPYENTLVGPAVQRLIQQNPRKSQSDILQMAASEVREFLKAEREKGKKEAEQAEGDRRKQAELASGLGSTSDTAPENVSAGETNEEYVKSRQEQLAKKKNPAYASG